MTSNSAKLVLVTGASGFLAQHVIDFLLEAGFRVRSTVRTAKYTEYVENVKIPNLQFCIIDDVAKSCFQTAFEGVFALIHVATQLPGRSTKDDIFTSSTEGVRHVLEEARKANVQKVVLTGTFGNLHTSVPGVEGADFYDETSWKTMTKEDFYKIDNDVLKLYFAGKVLQENEFWTFAENNKEMDLCVVHPGFIYGPFSANFPLRAKNNLGTNTYMFGLINGGTGNGSPPCFVDVRDIAKAHVLALDLPKYSQDRIRDKRFLITVGNYSWEKAANDAKTADSSITIATEFPFSHLDHGLQPNNSRSKDILKMAYTPPNQTMKDIVENLKQIQAKWPQEGAEAK